jgi:hypothetical protein
MDRAAVKRAVVAELERMSEESAEYILNAVTVEAMVEDIMSKMARDEEDIIDSYVYEYLKTDRNVDALALRLRRRK